uniref:FHA domain-containing protein n=1 Tax=Glossina brevipalpis TaxID=37001 RepID=A0A1A9X1X5_9MUSC
MSLEGAKLIRLDEAGNQCETIVAKGRNLTLGYYMSCDYVLKDRRAKGVHCEIECDALGRVFIQNFSEEHPVYLDDFPIRIKRTLLNGSKLSIFDTLFIWEFPQCTNTENADISKQATASTPQRPTGVPQQSAISCPNLKPHREVTKRLTVHKFTHCIQFDEEGNTEVDPCENQNVSDGENGQNETDQQEGKEIEELSKQIENDGMFVSDRRTQNLLQIPLIRVEETPKMDLIMCTENKVNRSTEKNKRQLALCQQSGVLITSYSPRQTGVCIEKSFTSLYTSRKCCNTPKSVRDGISVCMPSTSRNVTSTNLAATSNQNTSMHLVDLTITPNKTRPYLKAKSLAKKNLMQTTSRDKLASTPIIFDSQEESSGTPDSATSIITVSSTDTSSVVEGTPGESLPRFAKKTTSKRTNKASYLNTPKRTTQSLMKKVMQSSAKKYVHVTKTNINYVTPAKKLRGNAVSVLAPKSVEQTKACDAKLLFQSSLSTPRRKSIIKSNRDFDNCVASTSQGARRSVFNPLSGTSTPLMAAEIPAIIREGTPLHKMRTFMNVTQRSPLTNNTFTPKSSSSKRKSAQVYLSERLVLRARKSLNNISPITSSRRPNMARGEQSASERILADNFKNVSLTKKDEKNVAEISDEFSRTFIIDSNKDANPLPGNDESSSEENLRFKNVQKELSLNLTFSSEKTHTGEKLKKDVPLAASFGEIIKISKERISGQTNDIENSQSMVQSINYAVDTKISDALNKNEIEETMSSTEIVKVGENNSSETINEHGIIHPLVIVKEIGDVSSVNDFEKLQEPINKIEVQFDDRTVANDIKVSQAKVETEENANASKEMEEDTSKLLEEIEIVLNKSDEFYQKHLEYSEKTKGTKAELLKPTDTSNTVNVASIVGEILEKNEPVSIDKFDSGNPLNNNVASTVDEVLEENELVSIDKINSEKPLNNNVSSTVGEVLEENEPDSEQALNNNRTSTVGEVLEENEPVSIDELASEKPLNNNVSSTVGEVLEENKLVSIDKLDSEKPFNNNVSSTVSEILEDNEPISIDEPDSEKPLNNNGTSEEITISVVSPLEKEKNASFSFPMKCQMETLVETSSMSPPSVKEEEEFAGKVKAEQTSEIPEIGNFASPSVPEVENITPSSSYLNEKVDEAPLTTLTSSNVRSASLIFKNSAVFTPNSRRNRRASCTVINELLLTTKGTRTRRLSISSEDEKAIIKSQTSRADTSRNLFNLEHLNIPLEMNEEMGAIIGENADIEKDENTEEEQEEINTIEVTFSDLITETIGTSESVICEIIDGSVQDFTTAKETALKDSQYNFPSINVVVDVKDLQEKQQSVTDVGRSTEKSQRRDAEEVITKTSEVLDNSDYGYGNELDETSFNAESEKLLPINVTSERCAKGEPTTVDNREENLKMSDAIVAPLIVDALEHLTPMKSNSNEELPCTSKEFLTSLEGVKQLFNTPISHKTSRFTGRDETNRPKHCSTPIMHGLKESLNVFDRNENSSEREDVEAQQDLVIDKRFDKFLVTPRAKNLMIAALPSSAIIEKGTNFAKITETEFDFNISQNDNALLDDLFKTPVTTLRLTSSYIEEEERKVEQRGESSDNINKNKQHLEIKLSNHEPPKEVFDEPVQELAQICTPVSSLKEGILVDTQTLTKQSALSPSDVLSDLSKTDVKEWVKSLKKPETSPTMLECNYQEDLSADLSTKLTMSNASCSYARLYLPLRESVVDITGTSDVMLDITSISQNSLTDPLADTSNEKFANKDECSSPSLISKADFSGIHLLDKTTESMSDEQSLISDNDSEKCEQISTLHSETTDDDKVYQLSEPLIVTDSEDFNMSHDGEVENSLHRNEYEISTSTKKKMEQTGELEEPEKESIVDCGPILPELTEKIIASKRVLIEEGQKSSTEEKEPGSFEPETVLEPVLEEGSQNISVETIVPKQVVRVTGLEKTEIERDILTKPNKKEKPNDKVLESPLSKIESPASIKLDEGYLTKVTLELATQTVVERVHVEADRIAPNEREKSKDTFLENSLPKTGSQTSVGVDGESCLEDNCQYFEERAQTIENVNFLEDSKAPHLEEKDEHAAETDPITSAQRIVSSTEFNVLDNQSSTITEKHHPNDSNLTEVSSTYDEINIESSQMKLKENLLLKGNSEANFDDTETHERKSDIFTPPTATCAMVIEKIAETAQLASILSDRDGTKDEEFEVLFVDKQQFETTGNDSDYIPSREALSVEKNNETAQKGLEHLENSGISVAIVETLQAPSKAQEEEREIALSSKNYTKKNEFIAEGEFMKNIMSGEFGKKISSKAELISNVDKISEKEEKSSIEEKEAEAVKKGTNFKNASEDSVLPKAIGSAPEKSFLIKEVQNVEFAEKLEVEADISNKADETEKSNVGSFDNSLLKANALTSAEVAEERSAGELFRVVHCEKVIEKSVTIEKASILEDSKVLHLEEKGKIEVIETDPITSSKIVSTSVQDKISSLKDKIHINVSALPGLLLQRNSKTTSEDTENQERTEDVFTLSTPSCPINIQETVEMTPMDALLSTNNEDGIVEIKNLETENALHVQDEEFEELFVDEQQFESLEEAPEETASTHVLLMEKVGERAQKERECLDNPRMSTTICKVTDERETGLSSHLISPKDEFIAEREFAEEIMPGEFQTLNSEIPQVFEVVEKTEISDKREEEFVVQNLNIPTPAIQVVEALSTDNDITDVLESSRLVECKELNMDQRLPDDATDIVGISSTEGTELANSQELGKQLVSIGIFSSAESLTETFGDAGAAAEENAPEILISSAQTASEIEETKTEETFKDKSSTIHNIEEYAELDTNQVLEKKREIKEIRELTNLSVTSKTESHDIGKIEKQSEREGFFNEKISANDNEVKSNKSEIVVLTNVDNEKKLDSSTKQAEENCSKEAANDTTSVAKRTRARKASQFSECSDADSELASTKRAGRQPRKAQEEQLPINSQTEQEDSKQQSSAKHGRRKVTTSESSQGSTFGNNDGDLIITRKTRRKLKREPILKEVEEETIEVGKMPEPEDVERTIVEELRTAKAAKSIDEKANAEEAECFAVSRGKQNKKLIEENEKCSFNIAHLGGFSSKEAALLRLRSKTPVGEIELISSDPTVVTLQNMEIKDVLKQEPKHLIPVQPLDPKISYPPKMKKEQEMPKKRGSKRRIVPESSHSSVSNIEDTSLRARRYNREPEKEENTVLDAEIMGDNQLDKEELTQQQSETENLKIELHTTLDKNDSKPEAFNISEKVKQSVGKMDENLDTSSKRPLRRRGTRRVHNEEETTEVAQTSKRRKPLESQLTEITNESEKGNLETATEKKSFEIAEAGLKKETDTIEVQNIVHGERAQQNPNEEQEPNLSSSTTATKRRTGKRKLEKQQKLLEDKAKKIKPKLELSEKISSASGVIEIISTSTDLKTQAKPVHELEESHCNDSEVEIKMKEFKNTDGAKFLHGASGELSIETAQEAGLLHDSQINLPQHIETLRESFGTLGVSQTELVSETGQVQSPTKEVNTSITKRPQRKAAVAYHNYDETSDTEMSNVIKGESEPSLKSLTKNISEVISESNQGAARIETAIGVVTTTRGRMRKPTAKVQQFLEKERAKAESPKKRNVRSNISPAEQRKPGRRGLKPSVTEMKNAELLNTESGSPYKSKRSRARPIDEVGVMITNAESSVQQTATSVADVRLDSVEPQSDITAEDVKKLNYSTMEATTSSGVKSRRRGKAKLPVEQLENEELTRKKIATTFDSEKQKVSSPVVDELKPTRVAGRRNAAAAAKARIEEDALAAAAIDHPKKTRTKRAAPRTPTTQARDSNMEVDEDKAHPAPSMAKEKRQVLTTSQKRDHRLTSASTVGSTDGFPDIEGQIENESAGSISVEREEQVVLQKPATKREARNKAAALVSNDTMVVPAKRTRKGKSTDHEREQATETKGTTRTTRTRKVVHFEPANEIAGQIGETTKTAENANETKQPPQRLPTADKETSIAASTSQQTSMTLSAEAIPAKRTIRTRRK